MSESLIISSVFVNNEKSQSMIISTSINDDHYELSEEPYENWITLLWSNIRSSKLRLELVTLTIGFNFKLLGF